MEEKKNCRSCLYSVYIPEKGFMCLNQWSEKCYKWEDDDIKFIGECEDWVVR